jgi:hypothetical protein
MEKKHTTYATLQEQYKIAHLKVLNHKLHYQEIN